MVATPHVTWSLLYINVFLVCSDSDDDALVRLHGGSPICDSQVEVKGDVGCTAGKRRFNGSGACVAGEKENTGKEKGQNVLAVHENLSSLSQDLVEPLSINKEDREGETRRRDIETRRRDIETRRRDIEPSPR